MRNDTLDFKFLAESISHLVFVVLPDLSYAYANSKYLEYSGLTLESASGDGWKTIIHSEDLPPYERAVDEAVATGGGMHAEARLRRASDSAYRWHLIKAQPFKNEDGSLRYWVVTCTDVHDEKMANEEVRAMRDKIELALEDASIAFFDWDFRHGRFTSTENYYQLYGLKTPYADDPYGQFIESLHPDDRGRVKRLIDESISGKGKDQYNFESRTLWPDRSVHWVSSSSRIIRDEKGTPLFLRGIVKDITQAKEIEAALEKALRLRDDFLSIASHELKTPLTSISMQIEVIQKNLFPKLNQTYVNTRLEGALKLISRNSRRLGLLVEQLLDVARLGSEKMGLNFAGDDLASLIRNMVEQFSDQIDASGSEVTLNLPESAQSVFDTVRIEQVVVNLLTNAVKYGQGKPIEISLTKEEPFWVIRIRDHGIGIAKEHLDKLFERFSRSHLVEQISGLGLGLYIARQIVEAHNGKISVESRPGKGSTFTVKIPV